MITQTEYVIVSGDPGTKEELYWTTTQNGGTWERNIADAAIITLPVDARYFGLSLPVGATYLLPRMRYPEFSPQHFADDLMEIDQNQPVLVHVWQWPDIVTAVPELQDSSPKIVASFLEAVRKQVLTTLDRGLTIETLQDIYRNNLQKTE